MPRITKIYPLPAKPPTYPEAKVLVYIDGKPCTPVRARIWTAMGLGIGSEISCPELRERERFHWKRQYGAVGAWEKEKRRLDRIRRMIEQLDDRIAVHITGFGANTTALISEHPKEPGEPDIEVRLRKTDAVVVLVEVTGTERMRGTSYWVRPDKLEYASNHPDKDVWIALHYSTPEERVVFLKPRVGAPYKVMEKVIRYSVERYVEFDDDSPGVVQPSDFRTYLRAKIDRMLLSPDQTTYRDF